MTRENAFRKHRESGAETHSKPICLKPPGRPTNAAEISKLVVSIFCSRCAFQTEDYIFAQSHHHPLARDRGDARLNWTKSTCGFCSSITTATAQRANKLKNSGHFVSIKLFSEYNPAALQPASGQACRLKTLFKWCLVIVNRQL